MADALCYDDLDPNGTELDDAGEELAQDSYHRLVEAPGTNPDDPDRGFGLNELLSGVLDGSEAARMEAELRKDDRVDAVQATITGLDATSNAGASLAVDIKIQPEASIRVLLPGGT